MFFSNQYPLVAQLSRTIQLNDLKNFLQIGRSLKSKPKLKLISILISHPQLSVDIPFLAIYQFHLLLIILGCPIKIVLGWFSQKTDDLKENKRSYGIPDILGSIPIGRGCLKVVQLRNYGPISTRMSYYDLQNFDNEIFPSH